MPNAFDFDVIIAGAGAAGLMAAIRAAERGRRTLLLEKNTKAGVKILMSGGTRCNLTQNTDARGIIAAYGDQGRFLHSSLARLDPPELVKLFHAEGVLTKVEETNKIFPVSDSAVDVRDGLLRRLERTAAQLALNEPLQTVERQDEAFVITTPLRRATCEKLILTVGGKSYPGCGTRGDGYAWAEQFGHQIIPPRPALVPLTTHEDWVHDLSGLTLPDVRVAVVVSSRAPPDLQVTPESLRTVRGRKQHAPLAVERGSLLFTHRGLSGPVVLNASRAVSGHALPSAFDLELDFVPDVKLEALELDLQSASAADGKRTVVNLAVRYVPRRLAETLLARIGVAFDTKSAELGKAPRRALANSLKQTRVPLAGTLGFAKAEVTAGGVALDEVDSHTMQSKLVPNLYFAGEILDLDGPIGGYNFQAAFSTGFLAGESV